MSNEIDQAFFLDLQKLHARCQHHQLSYTFSFEEGCKLFNISTWSPCIDECYRTRDHSLSIAMELVFEFLDKLDAKEAEYKNLQIKKT